MRLDLDCHASINDIDVIQKGINLYNNEKIGESPKEFCIYLRDESNIDSKDTLDRPVYLMLMILKR